MPAGPLSLADPRAKWLGTLLLVVVFVTNDSPVALGRGLALTLAVAVGVARLSPSRLVGRLLLALPFAAVAAIALALAGHGGLHQALVTGLRLTGAVVSVALLTLTTQDQERFRAEVAAHGGEYLVVRRLEDLTESLGGPESA